MIDLDALVIEKRLSCEDDCSFQVRLKKYKEQRKNLGELIQLKLSPRGAVPEEVTPARRYRAFKRIERTVPGEDMDSEWFDISKKRKSGGEEESSRPTKQIPSQAETQRREAVALMKKYAKLFTEKEEDKASNEALDEGIEWGEINRQMKEYFFKINYMENLQSNLEQAELSAYMPPERRAVMFDNEKSVKKVLEYARDEKIKDLETKIKAYEVYRRTAPENGFVRDAVDEFHELQREDLGRLRDLRWDEVGELI